ncbi:MAG TPA: hypothetical protein VFA61_13750 [Candidatus Udaeobacter sp.]|nr:hypothetical protein [Candidatus Udaeobacter sp.]
MAKAIADQLRAKLTGQEEEDIAAKPTDNPEAYDAYSAVGPEVRLSWALLSSITPKERSRRQLPDETSVALSASAAILPYAQRTKSTLGSDSY